MNLRARVNPFANVPLMIQPLQHDQRPNHQFIIHFQAFLVGRKILAETLAYLLGSECADAVQSEAEDHPILFSEADVEGVVLNGHSAAVEAVANSSDGVDQRGFLLIRLVLEIEEEGEAAIEPLLAIAEENGRAPLGAAHGARLFPARIRKPRQRRDEVYGACVIETLEDLKQRFRQAKGHGHGAQSLTLNI